MHANEPDPEKFTSCNAFYMNAESIIYNDSKIYLFTSNASVLYQISLDGTQRKKIHSFQENVMYATIHRGYLYYSTSDFGTKEDDTKSKTKCKLSRINIDKLDAKPELLYEYSGIEASISCLTGYQEHVFFCVMDFKDLEMKGYSCYLGRYDIQKNNIQRLGNDIGGFVICGNKIVYNYKEQIYLCEMDGSGRKLMEHVRGDIISDPNYILADSLFDTSVNSDKTKRELNIFNMDGNRIQSIDISSIGKNLIYGGDNKYILIPETLSRKNEFGYIKALWVIDKRKIASGTAKPEKVFEFIPMVEDKGVVTHIE